ncbi:unnamed protein product [Zymoseptoria tritici ST99CH_3D7]|uniref:Uncharacterized protein n=1 Tax=Zymoseptoria tritici (strain ST99CH_3D7) TaxID=1276538 RepID=A0A1X7RRN0_ZYMT9|nr:unnamed protein product [Zymoseptoria tritici ST99CH_3D7]
MATIPCDRVSKSPLASRSQCSGPVKQISCVPGLVLWLHNFDKQRSDARHTAPDRTYLSRWDEDLKASTRAKQFKFDLFCVGDSAGRNAHGFFRQALIMSVYLIAVTASPTHLHKPSSLAAILLMLASADARHLSPSTLLRELNSTLVAVIASVNNHSGLDDWSRMKMEMEMVMAIRRRCAGR